MTKSPITSFALHKGTPQKKVSKLWKKYKDGKYKLPAEEGKDFVTVNEGELYIPPPEKATKAITPIEVEIEEEVAPVEEKSDLEVIGDLCKKSTHNFKERWNYSVHAWTMKQDCRHFRTQRESHSAQSLKDTLAPLPTLGRFGSSN